MNYQHKYILGKLSTPNFLNSIYFFPNLQINAAGDYIDPFIIFAYSRLPSDVAEAMKLPNACDYNYNPSGYMQEPNFKYWLEFVFHKNLKKKDIQFPVILFVDNHSSHISEDIHRLSKRLEIHLICLYPNSTHIIQPLDVSYFYTFKRAWSRYVTEKLSDKVIQGVNATNFSSLLKGCLETYHEKKWAQKGFYCTGIFPWDYRNINFNKIRNSCIRSKAKQEKRIWTTQVVEQWKTLNIQDADSSRNIVREFEEVPMIQENLTDTLENAGQNHVVNQNIEINNPDFISTHMLSPENGTNSFVLNIENIDDNCVSDAWTLDGKSSFNISQNNSIYVQPISEQSSGVKHILVNDDTEDLSENSFTNNLQMTQSDASVNSCGTFSQDNVTTCDDFSLDSYVATNLQVTPTIIESEYPQSNTEQMPGIIFELSASVLEPTVQNLEITSPSADTIQTTIESLENPLDLTVPRLNQSEPEIITNCDYDSLSLNLRLKFYDELKAEYGPHLQEYDKTNYVPKCYQDDILHRVISKFKPVSTAKDLLVPPPATFRLNKRKCPRQPFVVSSDEFLQFRSQQEKQKHEKLQLQLKVREENQKKREEKKEQKAKEKLQQTLKKQEEAAESRRQKFLLKEALIAKKKEEADKRKKEKEHIKIKKEQEKAEKQATNKENASYSNRTSTVRVKLPKRRALNESNTVLEISQIASEDIKM